MQQTMSVGSVSPAASRVAESRKRLLTFSQAGTLIAARESQPPSGLGGEQCQVAHH
jgi:hypothetical protein